ncbi:fasciclin domain-containing protein [Salinibacter grassmerensis]|uniref:fasciclin domain-containing protein n=1 Tax=Salinibacter grassmerensis TaxID=3040353 RepID=UPI0021E88B1B|nr:fasciclin domain-containing protein [Salinibacter grassmerensis]
MIDFASLLRRGRFVGVGLLVFTFILTGCDAFTDQDLGDSNPQSPTIAEYIQEVRVFGTLETAVTEAGLTGTLENDGVTVFAPTDDAFGPIDTADLLADGNDDLLTEVLTYHVVPQEIKVREGENALGAGATRTYETLEGDSVTVRVTESSVTVNGVAVSNADADASNGVVHVTEGLLLETADAVDRAELTSQFRILKKLVDRAELASTLRGMGPSSSDGLTLFAPTNEALLGALDQNDNGRVDDGEIPSNAADILQYHVLDDVFFVDDVPTSATDVPTLEGSNVTVQRLEQDSAPDSVTVDGNPVTLPDAKVENGVIHGIETVLMP